MPREQLKTLTEQMYYLLLVVQTPNFGFGIMKDVKAMTNKRVKIGAGTLYALLSRFENDQIIYQVDEIDRKKYYQLTPKGKKLLKTEYQRLKQLVIDGKELENHED